MRRRGKGTRRNNLKTRQILLHVAKSHMELKYDCQEPWKYTSAYLPPCIGRARLLLTFMDHHLERMWMLSVKPSSRDVPASMKELFVYFSGMQGIWGSLGGCMVAHMRSLYSLRNLSPERISPFWEPQWVCGYSNCRHLQTPLEGAPEQPLSYRQRALKNSSVDYDSPAFWRVFYLMLQTPILVELHPG